MTTKRLIDYLKDNRLMKAIEIMIKNENKRYKNGDYNRQGIDDKD